MQKFPSRAGPDRFRIETFGNLIPEARIGSGRRGDGPSLTECLSRVRLIIIQKVLEIAGE